MKAEDAIYEQACALDNQDVPLEEWPAVLIAALGRAGYRVVRPETQFTTGHCAERARPGGCQRPNLHCGYPDCDRRPITQPSAEQATEDEDGQKAPGR